MLVFHISCIASKIMVPLEFSHDYTALLNWNISPKTYKIKQIKYLDPFSLSIFEIRFFLYAYKKIDKYIFSPIKKIVSQKYSFTSSSKKLGKKYEHSNKSVF